jgi:hypothetical protein
VSIGIFKIGVNEIAKTCLLSLLSSTLIVAQIGCSQEVTEPSSGDEMTVDSSFDQSYDQSFDPTVDSLERQLEVVKHEKLLNLIALHDTPMTEFWTDGCSGGLSAGWEYLSEQLPEARARHGEHPPWESCCEIHDVAYHEGGLRSESAGDSFDQRKAADLELLSCVAGTAVQRSDELEDLYKLSNPQVELLYQSIAELMYRAVRLGGVPCSNRPWRWGYGWPSCE